jgi:hypothetical protein
LRDEGAAFRLVLVVVAAASLVAFGSWLDTWLGLAVFVLLVGGAVVVARRGRPRHAVPRPQPEATADRSRRILVVANEALESGELVAAICSRTGEAGEVLVVVPVLDSRLRTWTSAHDVALTSASSRLSAILSRLRAEGVQATGQLGEGDPVRAVEDALRGFSASEVILAAPATGRSAWLDHGFREAIEARFALPLTHVVVGEGRETSI